MNKYFLDTSFIIAYTIEDDNQHQKTDIYEDIITNKECFINNSVLMECVTVGYNKTKDLKIANEIYYILADNLNIINEYGLDNYNIKTLNNLNKYKGKLSFVDSGIITTMEHYNIKKLLTFDKEFKKVPTVEVITK